MHVKHCPKCGSGSIGINSYSAEYMSSTRYTCKDCEWYYKQGRGMGTGSGNAGTHPRRAGPSDGQSTLTTVGTWCHNCETCAKPGYCRCLQSGGTGFCTTCAEYSERETNEMIELRSYQVEENCVICEEETAELKVLD